MIIVDMGLWDYWRICVFGKAVMYIEGYLDINLYIRDYLFDCCIKMPFISSVKFLFEFMSYNAYPVTSHSVLEHRLDIIDEA
jgi:hypothetical protein